MRTSVTLEQVGALLSGSLHNPSDLLGPREITVDGRRALAVRAFLPETKQAWLLPNDQQAARPMRRIHPAGLYEAICPLDDAHPRRPYQLRLANKEGAMTTQHDPYYFEPYLSDFDLHLFGEGKFLKGYEKLGAQPREIDGVQGINFAVWAPNAQAVNLVGDFNHWDGRRHPLRKHRTGGVWELFIPEMKVGEHYKYRVKSQWGETMDKTDPYGFAAELPPRTASIVADLNQFSWQDQDWLQRRDRKSTRLNSSHRH